MAHGASAHTSTNGQFFARSSPLQAVSQEKDSAGQSFVARGPPACFGASARTVALASNLSCDSRPSNVDATSSLAAVIIDCLDFLQHGGRARPHLVGRCRPRTRSTAYKQLCLSSHKLRGPRCLSSHNRTNRQLLARSSPLQAVSPEKDCAESFVARGPPVCFGQPRAISAPTTALPGSLSCNARPYKQLRKSARQSCVARTVPQLAQALTDSFLHEARPCKPCRKRKTAQGKASPPACFAQLR